MGRTATAHEARPQEPGARGQLAEVCRSAGALDNAGAVGADRAAWRPPDWALLVAEVSWRCRHVLPPSDVPERIGWGGPPTLRNALLHT